MPFDALTMAAETDDVNALATGGRIQKIIQPSLRAVGLSVYKDGRQRRLLLSADPRYARVQMSDLPLAKAFPTPSAFIMLLRKYLDGARLLGAEQVARERVLVLSFHGSAGDTRLIVEVMGKHSNIVLVDPDNRILGAVKNVPPRESRVRPVLPGLQYVPPPAQHRDTSLYPPGHRVDPHLEPEAFMNCLSTAPPDTPLRRAVLGLLAGCGPFLADQIAFGAGAGPNTPLGEVEGSRLREAADHFYALYDSREWEPTMFTDRQGRPDFAPYLPLYVENIRRMESISAAIEQSVQADESRDVLDTVRKPLLAEVQRMERAAQWRAESLRAGLSATEEAEEVMQRGQLILAYQHAISPRSQVLDLPDLGMSIPLDPALTPQENAERAFRRYRKLRDARGRIPPLLREAEAEADRLHDVAAFVPLAESEADLRELRRELSASEPDGTGKKGSREKRRGPRRFSLRGYTAIVGRSARENEEVTFRLGKRDDLWLHARERTGAHVVLQRQAGDPPEEILEAAAALAAYFSEGREDSRVDVDVAAVRDVRKIPGVPPGRVTYRNFRTARVTPGMGEWEAESRS